MFKVGILGTENTHAAGFCEVFNAGLPEYKEAFSDIRVVALGGIDPQASRALCEKYGAMQIVSQPEDLIGQVDAVMITARDGKYHAPWAQPLIKAGLPAFIDKPFTSDPCEALSLARLAKEMRVPISGGSSVPLSPDINRLRTLVREKGDSLRGGDITAPVSLVNDYGNFWFYASHLVECTLHVFGEDPQWVWASRTANGVTAIVHYPAIEVTQHFTDGAYHYSGTLYAKDETVHVPISLDEIRLLECRDFAQMLRTGRMPTDYEALVRPVFVMAALEKSFLTGEKQPVESFTI